jgi:ArsR family transcriptional regulator, arsenate/arsenite/antimonite-responsive transcriptional repressor
MNMLPEVLFRALSDPTRLRCLALLQQEEELCVCELVHALDLPQPRISRHLAQLRDCGLVLDRRRGQWVFYRLRNDLPQWVQAVLLAALEAVGDMGPYETDRHRLLSMAERTGRPASP